MRFFILVSAILMLLATSVSADWWNSIVDSVQEKVSDGAGFIRDTAGEKFGALKAKLEDSETKDQVESWITEVSFFLSNVAGYFAF